jgi:hypothetical protein
VADQAYADPALHAELRKQCLDYMVGPQQSLLPPDKKTQSPLTRLCVCCVWCVVCCATYRRRIGTTSRSS